MRIGSILSLLVLAGGAAHAQTYDYTQTLSGTESIGTMTDMGPVYAVEPFTTTISGQVGARASDGFPEFSFNVTSGPVFADLAYGTNDPTSPSVGFDSLSFTIPNPAGDQGGSFSTGPQGTTFGFAENCLLACTTWSASTTTPANWVAVPEISGAGTMNSLVLLLGILAAMRGGRPLRPSPPSHRSPSERQAPRRA